MCVARVSTPPHPAKYQEKSVWTWPKTYSKPCEHAFAPLLTIHTTIIIFQFHDFLNKMSQFPALLMMREREKNWIFLLIFKKFCHSVSMEFFWLVGYNKSCILKVMSFLKIPISWQLHQLPNHPKWKNDNSQLTSRQIRKRMINSSDYQLDSWYIISQIFQKKILGTFL